MRSVAAQVQDVMTQATVTAARNDSPRTAAERMWRIQTGSLLFTDNGQLAGVITERDVLGGSRSALTPTGAG